jgi:hypothetical protein
LIEVNLLGSHPFPSLQKKNNQKLPLNDGPKYIQISSPTSAVLILRAAFKKGKGIGISMNKQLFNDILT